MGGQIDHNGLKSKITRKIVNFHLQVKKKKKTAKELYSCSFGSITG